MSDRGIRPSDLDDVIEIAARRAEQRSDVVTRAEIEAIARELDIPDADVDAALHELERRRAAEAAAAGVARANTRARAHRIKQAAIGLAVALVVLLGWSWWRLSGRHAALEAQRAQVYNVVERQAATVEQWGDRPASPERDAELSGAENRVRIERRHYDAAAAAYNRVAGGFPAVIFRGLLGYPPPAPLSNEADWSPR